MKHTKSRTANEPALSDGTALDAVPTRSRKRPKMIALGVALIALGGLGGVWTAHSLSSTEPAVAVGRDLSRGQVIAAEDLKQVEIPKGAPGLSVVPAAQQSDVIGKVAQVDLKAGSLLTPESYSQSMGIPASSAIVGIAVSPSQAPGSRLVSGDAVTLVKIASGPDQTTTIESPMSWSGKIVASRVSEADSTIHILDVEVRSSDAPAVAALAAADQIAIVLDGGK